MSVDLKARGIRAIFRMKMNESHKPEAGGFLFYSLAGYGI